MRESLTIIGEFNNRNYYAISEQIEDEPEMLWAFGEQTPVCIGDHQIIYHNCNRGKVTTRHYRDLSRKFPDFRFIVERVDDNFNLARLYIQNGRLAMAVPEIKWLPFDWDKMREVEL